MYNITTTFTVRLTLSLTICTSLLMPGVSLAVSEAAQGQSGAHPVRPGPSRPEGQFPDLDEIKNESNLEREPAAPIPSTIRARRNEGKPWDGRRVGEPFAPGQLDQAAANRTDRRNRQSLLKRKLLRSAHASRRFAPAWTVLDSQFIQNFFSLALTRSASSEENLYWSYQLRAAYGVGPTSVKLAGIELGRTLFESASYAARNRNAHDYVYDLYKTYLMREPDAGGWATWEALVPTHGREYVRRGFEESTEFASLMANIVPGGSGSASASSLISALVDARNQPGNGMLTRDASWSVALLSLPGRNGLDLGLSLSYSSMVWTRSGPYFYFDEDNGFPSPGFRLGFPTVQRKVFDAQTARNSYLLITPAGRRVDLRQVGSSTVYEAADSSYLQLSENGGNLLVRSADGTQLTFDETNNEYRCTQIKDRNGNYISVNYNTLGRITTITDTLGRVITFNYDTNANLLSITQAWNGQPSHQWVSFGWSTRNMQYSFANDSVIGTRNGALVPVITQVGLNDTSHFTFNYTNSLQVSEIRNYFGTLERNATTFTYQTASGDVPRLSSSSVSARNWSGYNNVPAQVTTQYSVAVDGACELTAPDGTIYKEYYGTGWQKGLMVLSEIWSGGVKQKWTTTSWTQNDPSLTYPLNPRVNEVNVYDASNNRRRTTIHYDNSQYAQYGLPSEVREYAADAGTVIRKTLTDYNLSQTYLDRHIIGLVSQVQLANGSEYLTKTTYAYDDPVRLAALPAAPTQHDASYSSSFTTRGNVTSVSRWDVTDISKAAKKLTSYTNYYTTGSPASNTDPAGHQQSILYADAFSDNVNRNTFAYPTTLTDADGHSSYVQYKFDFGGPTRTQSPAPAGQSQGAIQTMTYNNLGQLERVTTTNNNAYKRFWYGAEFTASYATVNNVADEAYSVAVTDGLGRVIGELRNHPGSTLGYSLVHRVYDLMGRVWLQSNPSEVNSAWVTTGGDDNAGIYYTQQTYDWQGRPLVTTNPDLTTKTASYSGCGCAGGEVVTLTDEGTIDAGVAKRRQRKIYSDVLGRTVKTEVLNWQDGSPYSTTVNIYNARDQVTQVRQYAGPAGSGTYQDTTFTFDGYGRLKTRHVPEQDANVNTTWDYNSDDTIKKTTDGRGATATFSYNNRHLVTAIAYAAPSPIPGTPNTSFSYDAAANRTSMNDASGSTSYQYNQLSQLTAETKTFAGLPGSYTLAYEYGLSGNLKSLTDHTNKRVNYFYDQASRLNSITGTNYSITNLVNSVEYRAWNVPQQVVFGNGRILTFAYNQRLSITHLEMPAQSGLPAIINRDYEYHNDKRVKYFRDNLDARYDRAFNYDHSRRLNKALSGAEARGEPASGNRPYNQFAGHDAFDHLTSRTSRHWSKTFPDIVTNSFSNNRRTGWQYDADGNLLNDGSRTFTLDAVARIVASSGGNVSQVFDGDGRRVKTIEPNLTTYYLTSTVLAQVIAQLNGSGTKTLGFIYAASDLLAEEFSNGVIVFVHRDASGLSVRKTHPTSGILVEATELDAQGADMELEDPYLNEPEYDGRDEGGPLYPGYGNATSPGDCTVDGIWMPCDMAYRLLGSGAAVEAPPEGTIRYSYETGKFELFRAFADGYSGFLPIRARYGGRGIAETGYEESVKIGKTRHNPVPFPGVDAVRDRLNMGDCNAYIASLLAKANELYGSSGNEPVATDGIDLLAKIKAFTLVDFLKIDDWPVAGTVSGSVKGNNTYAAQTATVELSTRFMYGNSASTIAMWQANYVSTAIHEMLHLAARYSGYSDTQLATAASKLPGAAAGLPAPPKNNRDRNGIFANSDYYHNELMKHCGPPNENKGS